MGHYGQCMFNFVRNWQFFSKMIIPFYINNSSVWKSQLLHIPDNTQYSSLASISHSKRLLMISHFRCFFFFSSNGVEHRFRCFVAVQVSSLWKIYPKSLPLPQLYYYYYYWVVFIKLWVLHVFCIPVFWQMYIWTVFFFYGLFSFSWSISQGAEVLNFDGVQCISAFF